MLALLRIFRQQASARDRAHCARSRDIQTDRSQDRGAAQKHRKETGRPPTRTEDTSRCRHSLAAGGACAPSTVGSCPHHYCGLCWSHVARPYRTGAWRMHARHTEHLSIAMRARPTLRG